MRCFISNPIACYDTHVHQHIIFIVMSCSIKCLKCEHIFRDGRKPTSRNGNQYPAKCKCVMCVVLACAYVVYHHNIVNKQQRTWHCIQNMSTQLHAPSDISTMGYKSSEHCFSNSGQHRSMLASAFDEQTCHHCRGILYIMLWLHHTECTTASVCQWKNLKKTQSNALLDP